MAKYRYGLMQNLIGDEWYQVQIKRMGLWWNDESFSTYKGLMNYIHQLEKEGNIIFRIN